MQHSHLTDGLKLQTELLRKGDVFFVNGMYYRVVAAGGDRVHYTPVQFAHKIREDFFLPRNQTIKVEVVSVMVPISEGSEKIRYEQPIHA